MKELEVPGTTFRKHLEISRGLMSEDNYLLSEILLNPFTLEQVENIHKKLEDLIAMIRNKDENGIHGFFQDIRHNIGMK